MTDAERQRRRRAKLRPPFDAESRAQKIMEEVAERAVDALPDHLTYGQLEDAVEEMQKALIAAMVVELGRNDFVTTVVTEDHEHTVTISVTEKKRPKAKKAGR